MEWFDKFADRISKWSGSLPVVVAAFTGVIAWILGGFWVGFGDLYQLLINTSTTIITFLLVFVIQHTQNKDSRAVHAKLDELIKKNEKTSDRLVRIEEKTEEEIEEFSREE